jgi:nitroreductase
MSFPSLPFPKLPEMSDAARIERARAAFERLSQRHTCREFTDQPVPREVIEAAIRAAGTAPSGANHQPWHFAVIASPDLKRRIRAAAEAEEREFYARRASRRWLEDLAPLGTDADKSYLEVAPWLVAVMRTTGRVYYGVESVGIAVGLLLAAAHFAGLATLTHTPSPMAFLNRILDRPASERPFVLVPIGYPAEGCVVPEAALSRKPLEEIMVVR